MKAYSEDEKTWRKVQLNSIAMRKQTSFNLLGI